jgi:uncharacterized membrane protein YqjE
MRRVDRSFSEVLHDIIGNIQDIIRAEVRLAKTEVREEISRARSGVLLLAIGTMAGIFCVLFILLAVLIALASLIPESAAALIVAFGLALCAVVTVTQGVRRLKRVEGTPKTIASLKENVEWAKQQTK